MSDFFRQGLSLPSRDVLPAGPLEPRSSTPRAPKSKPKPKTAALAAPNYKAPSVSKGQIGIRGSGYRPAPKVRGSVVDVDAKQNAPDLPSIGARSPGYMPLAPDLPSIGVRSQGFASPAPRVQGPLFDPKATAKAMGQFDASTGRYESPDFSMTGKAKAAMAASLSKREGEVRGDRYTPPAGGSAWDVGLTDAAAGGTSRYEGFGGLPGVQGLHDVGEDIPVGDIDAQTLRALTLNIAGGEAKTSAGQAANLVTSLPAMFGAAKAVAPTIAKGLSYLLPRSAQALETAGRAGRAANAINVATGGILGGTQSALTAVGPLSRGDISSAEFGSDIAGGTASGGIGGLFPQGAGAVARAGFGAAGGGLGQAGYNVLTDKPLFEGVPQSAAIGAGAGVANPAQAAGRTRQVRERASSEAALGEFFSAPDGPLPYTPDEAAAFRQEYPNRADFETDLRVRPPAYWDAPGLPAGPISAEPQVKGTPLDPTELLNLREDSRPGTPNFNRTLETPVEGPIKFREPPSDRFATAETQGPYRPRSQDAETQEISSPVAPPLSAAERSARRRGIPVRDLKRSSPIAETQELTSPKGSAAVSEGPLDFESWARAWGKGLTDAPPPKDALSPPVDITERMKFRSAAERAAKQKAALAPGEGVDNKLNFSSPRVNTPTGEIGTPADGTSDSGVETDRRVQVNADALLDRLAADAGGGMVNEKTRLYALSSSYTSEGLNRAGIEGDALSALVDSGAISKDERGLFILNPKVFTEKRGRVGAATGAEPAAKAPSAKTFEPIKRPTQKGTAWPIPGAAETPPAAGAKELLQASKFKKNAGPPSFSTALEGPVRTGEGFTMPQRGLKGPKSGAESAVERTAPLKVGDKALLSKDVAGRKSVADDVEVMEGPIEGPNKEGFYRVRDAKGRQMFVKDSSLQSKAPPPKPAPPVRPTVGRATSESIAAAVKRQGEGNAAKAKKIPQPEKTVSFEERIAALAASGELGPSSVNPTGWRSVKPKVESDIPPPKTTKKADAGKYPKPTSKLDKALAGESPYKPPERQVLDFPPANMYDEMRRKAFADFDEAAAGRQGPALRAVVEKHKAEMAAIEAQKTVLIKQDAGEAPAAPKAEAPIPPKAVAPETPKPEPPIAKSTLPDGPLPVKVKAPSPEQEAKIAELRAERSAVEEAGSARLQEIRKTVSEAKREKPMRDAGKETQAQLNKIDAEIRALEGGSKPTSKKGTASVKFDKPGAEPPASKVPVVAAEPPAAKEPPVSLDKELAKGRAEANKSEPKPVSAPAKTTAKTRAAFTTKAQETDIAGARSSFETLDAESRAMRKQYDAASPSEKDALEPSLDAIEAKRDKAKDALDYMEQTGIKRQSSKGYFAKLARGETLGSGLGGLGGSGAPVRQGLSLGPGAEKAKAAVKTFFGRDPSPSGKLARKVNDKIVAAQEPESGFKTVARYQKANPLMSTAVMGRNLASSAAAALRETAITRSVKGGGKGLKEGSKAWKDVFFKGRAPDFETDMYKGWEGLRAEVRAKHKDDAAGFPIFMKKIVERGFAEGDAFKFERYEKIRQGIRDEGIDPDSAKGKEILSKAWMLPSERVKGTILKALDAYTNFGLNKSLRGTELTTRQMAVRGTIENEAAAAGANAGGSETVYRQALDDINARYSGKDLGDEARNIAADQRLARALATGDQAAYMEESKVSRWWGRALNRGYGGINQLSESDVKAGKTLTNSQKLGNVVGKILTHQADTNLPYVKSLWSVSYDLGVKGNLIGSGVNVLFRGLDVPVSARQLQKANRGLAFSEAMKKVWKTQPEVKREFQKAMGIGAFGVGLHILGYALRDYIDEPESYIPGDYEGLDDITKNKALEREGGSIHTPFGSFNYDAVMPMFSGVVLGAVIGKSIDRGENPWTETIPKYTSTIYKLLVSGNPYSRFALDAVKNAQGGLGDLASGFARTAARALTPAPTRAAARLLDTDEQGDAIERDTRAESRLGEIPNVIKADTPFLRPTLPPKITAYGKTETEPPGRALDPTGYRGSKEPEPEAEMLDALDIGMSKPKRDIKGGETPEAFAERQRVEGKIYEGKTKWITAPTLRDGRKNPNYDFLKSLDKREAALKEIGMTPKEMRQEIIKRGMNRETNIKTAPDYYLSIYKAALTKAIKLDATGRMKAAYGKVLQHLTETVKDEEE